MLLTRVTDDIVIMTKRALAYSSTKHHELYEYEILQSLHQSNKSTLVIKFSQSMKKNVRKPTDSRPSFCN